MTNSPFTDWKAKHIAIHCVFKEKEKEDIKIKDETYEAIKEASDNANIELKDEKGRVQFFGKRREIREFRFTYAKEDSTPDEYKLYSIEYNKEKEKRDKFYKELKLTEDEQDTVWSIIMARWWKTYKGAMYVGHRAGGFFAVGFSEEFQIWNTDLSQAEVTADYNAGAGVYGTSGATLVAGFHFDNALTDYSGNSYVAAFQGTTAYVPGLIIQSGTAGENEINVWNSKDGTIINEYGITTFGDSNAQTIIDGLKTVFKINGVEKARFDTNGFLGIGTTAPTAPLTLSAAAGAAAFTLQSAGTDIFTLNTSGLLQMSSGTLQFSNGASVVMSLATGGKMLFPFNFAVSAGDAPTTIASGLDVTARTTSTSGIRVYGITSQSADIFQVLNVGTTVLLGVTSGGRSYTVTGATAKTARIGGKIKEFYTSVGNVGTGEDDLYTYTTEASILANNGEEIDGTFGGLFVSSATATRQVKLYFGGTAIFDSGTLTISASASWVLAYSIIRVSSTVVRYRINLSTQNAALAAYTSVGELTGLTLANTNILKLTGEAAGVGAATDDIIAHNGDVFWWPVSV